MEAPVRSNRDQVALALRDLRETVALRSVWMRLASQDIRQRYRRSVLGPLWITLSMMVMIAGVGPLYGALFNVELREFLPHVAMGLIAWNLLSTLLIEGCGTFIAAENIVRSVRLPMGVHVMRTVYRTVLIFAHNTLAYLPVMLWLGLAPKASWWLVLPGLALLLLALVPVVVILGLLCTRYRDLAQIVASLVQLVFFVTPIFWQPQVLGPQHRVADFNPFQWLIELLRAPVLGHAPPEAYYLNVIALGLLLWLVAVPMFVALRRRVPFWI